MSLKIIMILMIMIIITEFTWPGLPTKQSPVVCPVPPHLMAIRVKSHPTSVTFELTHFVQTMLLVTLTLSWHCQDRWSVAPQFVQGAPWQAILIEKCEN
jgi:hypothetical protein